jgi:mono/diheme cytochrome c family protein
MREGVRESGMRRSLRTTIAVIGAVLALAACSRTIGDFVRGYAEGRAEALTAYQDRALAPEERGAVAFALSDFGALNTDTLQTHAVPWRLAAAALVLRDVEASGGEISRVRLRAVMRRFGFVYPEAIGNWPEGLPPPQFQHDAPLGLSVGVVKRTLPRVELTAANLSCASCHAGVVFNDAGAPDPQTAWLGAPNTSLDLELYVREVYAAIKSGGRDEERLFSAMRALFPETSEAELDTMRAFVMPRLEARMKQLETRGDRPLPFVNGAPGLTNGVAALRMQLGLLAEDAYAEARGFTSIPDLGVRGFRSSLLYDSAYIPHGQEDRAIGAADVDRAHLDSLADVTAFFTVPSMGVHPDRAADRLGEVRDIFTFLRSYKAPRFPGKVERPLAAQGRDIYAGRCATCHGAYDESVDAPRLLSFPNWIGAFDTDPVRAQVFDAATARAINESAYGARLQARSSGRYAAPPLAGVWMSAPYLHNGSIPTLWHLMHPEERPGRFQVGGHALDYALMGIAGRKASNGDYLYPTGYAPWSQPSLIDTGARGLSNRGHATPFGSMSEAERRALLEYLKLL